MNEKTVSLSFGLVNAIVQYLGTKPYQETFALIEAMKAQVEAAQGATEEPKPAEAAE